VGKFAIAFVLAALGLGLIPGEGNAQAPLPACVKELRPNDTLERAMPLSNAFCVTGEIGAGDQHIFVWNVTGDAARAPWSMVLSGMLDQQTRLQIHKLIEKAHPPGAASEPPEVGPQLFSLVANPPALQAAAPELFLAEGKYLIGLSASGGKGDYRIMAAQAPNVGPAATEPNHSADRAANLGVDLAAHGVLQGSEDFYAWSVDQQSARRRWTVKARIPLGAAATLELRRADGAAIVARSSPSPDGELALFDLALSPGEYRIRLSPAVAVPTPYALRIVSEGPRSPSHEEEPNDTVANANPLTLGHPIGGRIANAGDVDVFALPIGDVKQRVDVQLSQPGRAARKLCLLDDKGLELQCRNGSNAKLADLALTRPLFAAVSGAEDPKNPYTLTARVSGSFNDGDEREPNDTPASANLLDGKPVRGRFAGDDVDMFRLVVSGAPQLWSVDAKGDGIASLEIADEHGKSIARVATTDGHRDSASIEGALLTAGNYTIAIAGRDGAYTLSYAASGTPDAETSLEPNDTTDLATRLALGRERKGILTPTDKVDVYRFVFTSEELADVNVAADGECPLTLKVMWPTAVGTGELPIKESRQISYHGRFPPGEYFAWLVATEACTAAYKISLTRGDPAHPDFNTEPNNSAPEANPIPFGTKIEGYLADLSNWYRLPLLSKPTKARLHVTGGIGEFWSGAAQAPSIMRSDFDRNDPHATIVMLPANTPIWVHVLGNAGPFSFEVSLDDPSAVIVPSHVIDMKLDLPSAPIAAFWPRHQKIDGTLALENRTSKAVGLHLDGGSSFRNVSLKLAKTDLTLAPGEKQALAATVVADPDTWSQIVRLTVTARTDGGEDSIAVADIPADPMAEPVNEYVGFRPPDIMLGGFNVSATSFGASVPGADPTSEHLYLHDGFTTTHGFAAPVDKLPLTTVVEFGGGRTWPIVGLALNPYTPSTWPTDQLRDFDFLLSADGAHFETVLSATMQLGTFEQYFSLSHRVEARAAKLVFKSSYGSHAASLGEWKIIADPTATTGISLDLADPSRGGHVVAAIPAIGQAPNDLRRVLGAGGDSLVVKVEKGVTPQLILGFQDDRAAQIRRIEWVEQPGPSTAPGLKTVAVSVSTEGPVGPWKELTRWQIALDGKGRAAFDLSEPVWARFVKFAAAAPVAQTSELLYPTRIRIMERATDDTYRSILGEWGDLNKDAVYEWLSKAPASAVAKVGEHGSRERAQPLALESPVEGQVMLGRNEDWYRFDAPDDLHTLSLVLEGRPTVDVDLDVEDSQGHPVPVRTISSTATKAELEAPVSSGGTYFVHVAEPPHSVAVLFDTSGSLAGFIPTIWRGLRAVADSIVPGREAVNYMPFDAPFMFEDWTDQSLVIARALKPDPIFTSSGLENSMNAAMRGLAPRRGARAVFVVTDAATSSHDQLAKMWQSMAEVRPRVFAAQIGAGDGGGEGAAHEKQLMQDLAAANGGFYNLIHSQPELDVGFDRLAAWMHRPARYRLTLSPIKAPVVAALPPPVGSVSPAGSPTEPPATIAVIAAAPKTTDIATALKETGRVAIYGINFDVDKTIIKPASAPVLAQIAKLLKDDPSLALEVSGHTDSTGTAEHNMKLSDGRAAAVVAALVNKYGIAAARLKAQGYGQTRPVAENDTDAGRAQNRRVELRTLDQAQANGAVASGAAPDASTAGPPKQVAYSVYGASGERVLSGLVGDAAHEIAPGDYVVRVESGTQPIERRATVEPHRAAIVEVQLPTAAALASPSVSAAVSLPSGASDADSGKKPDAKRGAAAARGGAEPGSQDSAAPKLALRTPPLTGPKLSDSQRTKPVGVIAGRPVVLDTGTLVINRQIVKLAGVVGELGKYADQLTAYLSANSVECRPAGNAYRCMIGQYDLSEIIVFNGGGRATPDASSEIKAAELKARANGVGIWERR
jgi:outer membrane protein OmpA-like peptidoglycan-associated protein